MAGGSSDAIAIGLSLAAAVLWGLAPVLYKRFYVRFSASLAYLVDGLCGSTLVLLPFALSGRPDFASLPEATWMTLPYSTAYVMLLVAFERGRVSAVSVIVQTYPVYTIVLALSLGQEEMGPLEVGLVATIVAASILMAGLGAGGALKEGVRKPWFALAILTALLSGIGDYGLNASVDRHNVHTTTLAVYLTQIVACAAIALTRRKKLVGELASLGSDRFHLATGLEASLAMSLGAVACYAAFAHGPASLVSPISSASPVFAVLLARAWLKENVSMGQFGMVLVIVASLAGLSR